MGLEIDWQALKTLTGYERDDIKGFCEDEGFPTYPGRLHPFQALFLRNLLLCSWSVREGHFAYYWQAQQAFELFWAGMPDDASDYQLAASWIAWCEARSQEDTRLNHIRLRWRKPQPLHGTQSTISVRLRPYTSNDNP